MKKLAPIILIIAIVCLLPRRGEENVSAAIRNNYFRDGQASWYSENDRGVKRTTANNEIFDDSAMTCAMWGVEFNRKIRVTNKENGKSIILRVNDRGPHERFVRQGRILDMTIGAFAQLSTTHRGIIDVTIEFL
jgi:rare lipoprotein A